MNYPRRLILLLISTSLLSFAPAVPPIKLTWETLRDVTFKKNPRKFKTDERLTFQGTLSLNADDIYQMNYVLEAAEIAE